MRTVRFLFQSNGSGDVQVSVGSTAIMQGLSVTTSTVVGSPDIVPTNAQGVDVQINDDICDAEVTISTNADVALVDIQCNYVVEFEANPLYNSDIATSPGNYTHNANPGTADQFRSVVKISTQPLINNLINAERYDFSTYNNGTTGQGVLPIYAGEQGKFRITLPPVTVE